MVELERCGVMFVASFSRDSCQTLMSLLALPSISEGRCLGWKWEGFTRVKERGVPVMSTAHRSMALVGPFDSSILTTTAYGTQFRLEDTAPL